MLKRLLAIVALGAAMVACTPADPGTSPGLTSPDVIAPSDDLGLPSESPTDALPSDGVVPSP